MKLLFDYNKTNKEYIYKDNPNIVFKEIDYKQGPICYSLYLCLYRDFPKLESLLKYFKVIAKIS